MTAIRHGDLVAIHTLPIPPHLELHRILEESLHDHRLHVDLIAVIRGSAAHVLRFDLRSIAPYDDHRRRLRVEEIEIHTRERKGCIGIPLPHIHRRRVCRTDDGDVGDLRPIFDALVAVFVEEVVQQILQGDLRVRPENVDLAIDRLLAELDAVFHDIVDFVDELVDVLEDLSLEVFGVGGEL